MSETINVTSWDDLNDRVTFHVEVERPGGVMRIPLRELTYNEWIQIEIDNPWPSPPKMGGKNGVIYDREDPTWIRKVGECSQRWKYLRLLKALQVTVPGDTVDEQVKALSEMSAPLLSALMNQLESMHMANKARVEDRAGGFLSSDVALVEDAGSEGLDAE